MSFRFSIGTRWFEISIFDYLGIGNVDYLHVRYGNCSSNTPIRLMKRDNGSIVLWLGSRPKGRILKKASAQ